MDLRIRDTRARTNTHRHRATLPRYVPGTQQCCHGYFKTHPPSHKQGGMLSASEGLAPSLLPSSVKPSTPFSPQPPHPPTRRRRKKNRIPLFSSLSLLKNLPACQLWRPGSQQQLSCPTARALISLFEQERVVMKQEP